MIKAADLSLTKDQTPIIKNCHLEVGCGEIVGIIGPNGAGKTSLLRCLVGLEKYAGRIQLGGSDLDVMTEHQRAVSVAWVPATAPLPFSFSVVETILMGRYPWHQGAPTTGDLQRVRDILEKWGMSEFAARDVTTLSSGELEKVMICRALISDCPHLLMDEPCANLDVAASILFFRMISAAKSQGRSTTLTLHDLNFAQRYCDRLVLMDRGTIVATGAPKAVMTRENIATVYKTSCDWLTASDGSDQFVLIDSP